jgi:YVTN family beta-propeller protein
VTDPGPRGGFGAPAGVLAAAAPPVAVTIPLDAEPRGLAVSPDGRRLYLGHHFAPQITVIDAVAGTVAARIGLGSGDASDVAVSLDGRRVYAAHAFVAKVSVIDTATNAVVNTIGPLSSGNAEAVAVSSDGRRVYVTHGDSVSAIDAASNAVIAKIDVGPFSGPLAVTPDGRTVYVANRGGNEPSVSVIDTNANEVVATIANRTDRGVASQSGVAVAPDGGHVYVTSDWVSVIDTSTNEVVAIIPSSTQLWGVAVAPDGGFAYAAHVTSSMVSVVDTGTNAVVTRIRVGAGPTNVAVTAQNLYVANGLSKTITAVRIDDLAPGSSLVNRSGEFGTPQADAAPSACVIPGLGVHNIAYRDTSGRLHELWRDAQGATGTTNLTDNAGAPTAVGYPFAYADTSRNTEILLFRDDDGVVRSLYWSLGAVGHDNLGGTAQAPTAAGNPVGYYIPSLDAHHVVYRADDAHLHELNWVGVAPVVYGGNLTGTISAPTSAGDPSAYANSAGVNIVVYRSEAGEILSVYWADGPSGLDQLSGVAGTPPAAADPFAYYIASTDTHQVVYCDRDGHIWELYWVGVAPVAGWDLKGPARPAAVGTPAAYYSAGTNTKHVVYRSADGRLHELWWVPGASRTEYIDLTDFALAEPSADRPAAFTVEGPNTQHVAFRGNFNQIYEIRW